MWKLWELPRHVLTITLPSIWNKMWNHRSNVCLSCQKTKPGNKQTKWTWQGHFKDKQHKQRQGIHALDTTKTDVGIPTGATPETPQLYFHSLCIDSLSKTDTQAVLQLQAESGQCTTSLLCKIDTGAEGNVIPVNTFKQLCPQSAFDPDGAPPGLTPSATTITAFGGQTIQRYGTCSLTLSHNGYSNTYPFHVVNTTGPTILGLPTCRDMNLVILNYSITTEQDKTSTQKPVGDPAAKTEILQRYQDCFNGIGCFKGEFHITQDPPFHPLYTHYDVYQRHCVNH